MQRTHQTEAGQDRLAVNETSNTISSEKIRGTEVYNRNGDHLGEINHLMIDKISGQVQYAVMSFGGFLGIGEKYHPLPWDVLDYDTNKEGYVIDLDRDALERAPSYESTDSTSWSDRGWRGRVDEYYRPYL